MARQESDRDDPMREATALHRRAELRTAGSEETVVAGFRAGGRISLYFGSDPAFHFDAEGRLRRAFADGRLYRAQGSTFARLTRERVASATELRRHDLSPSERDDFLKRAEEALRQLHGALTNAEVAVVAQVPAADNLLPDLQAALERILSAGIRIAPPVPGRR